MTAPIVTVTLNPAIDQTLILDHLTLGEANHVVESRTDPGGKGINVSRVLRELGGQSIAAGFAPGGLGRFIEHELKQVGIPVAFVHTKGETRTNLTLITAGRHVTTTVHALGPRTDMRSVELLRRRLSPYLRPGSWLVVAGSIPPPLPPTVYRDLIAEANAAGVHTVLDAEDESLRAGLTAHPTLLKVNYSEFQAFVGEDLSDERRLIAAAERVHWDGVRWVLVTHSHLPTIAVNEEGVWRATPPRVDQVDSTVGAGDAALAGAIQVLADGGAFDGALRRALGAGSACVLRPGTLLCEAATVAEFERRVRVERLTSLTTA